MNHLFPQESASVRNVTRVAVMAVFCLVVFDVSAAFPQRVKGTEYQVKAGFIYNIARYVEWPPGTFENDDPIVLCVVSDNPETDIFLSLDNRMVGKRKMRVRKGRHLCAPDTDPDAAKIIRTLRSLPSRIMPKLGKQEGKPDGKGDREAEHLREAHGAADAEKKNLTNAADGNCDCHILFIRSADEADIQERLKLARNRSILTVGETEGFAKKMGGIISFFTEGNRLRFRVNTDAVRRAGLKFRTQLMMSAEIVREEP